MHFGAKRLITGIVGAQRVAMHNQDASSVEIQHLLFRQQLHTAFAGEATAKQEIAVAVNEIAGDAGLHERAQGGSYLTVQRFRVVIANPGLKEIAQNVKGVRFTRGTG